MAFYHPRPDLAAEIYQRMVGDSVLGAPAGVFLAAPRRTGKSSFLRRDLIPYLAEKGMRPVYVDLWADRNEAPAKLIANALLKSLEELATPAQKLRDLIPFDAISIGPVSVSVKDGEAGRTATLTDLILTLSDKSGTDIVLIIDEAQDTLDTDSDAENDVSFALKAARDAANQREGKPGLFLIFTGSNRDKLSEMVTQSKKAFYGGTITTFPQLGGGYVRALVDEVNPGLAEDRKLEAEDVEAAFALVGNRPELLVNLLRQHVPLGERSDEALKTTVSERADALKAMLWDELKTQYEELTETQQTVLRLMAGAGPLYSPYMPEALTAYAVEMGLPHSTEKEMKAVKSQKQKAIEALRDAHIIWRRARGLYAFEDRDMRDWLSHRFDG